VNLKRKLVTVPSNLRLAVSFALLAKSTDTETQYIRRRTTVWGRYFM